MGIPGKGEDILMFESISEQLPLFFNYHNLVFIGQAMLRTLGMTLIGCSVGFVAGLLLVGAGLVAALPAAGQEVREGVLTDTDPVFDETDGRVGDTFDFDAEAGQFVSVSLRSGDAKFEVTKDSVVAITEPKA